MFFLILITGQRFINTKCTSTLRNKKDWTIIYQIWRLTILFDFIPLLILKSYFSMLVIHWKQKKLSRLLMIFQPQSCALQSIFRTAAHSNSSVSEFGKKVTAWLDAIVKQQVIRIKIICELKSCFNNRNQYFSPCLARWSSISVKLHLQQNLPCIFSKFTYF